MAVEPAADVHQSPAANARENDGASMSHGSVVSGADDFADHDAHSVDGEQLGEDVASNEGYIDPDL
jgi:hypothetical protein